MESTSLPATGGRPDRKTVERNRRVRMKALYSQLDALLPSPVATTLERGSTLVPDRLDETVGYIKALQERIERMKEKQRRLLMRGGTGGSGQVATLRPPHIEVQDVGVGLQVTITSGPSDWFVFKEAIRVIQAEGGEIVSANFSAVGDKAVHVICLLVDEPKSGHEASRLLERLKNCIRSPF